MFAQHLERLAVHVLVEQARTDVGRAADRGRVAELLGRGLNGAFDLSFALGLARALTFHAEGDRAEERAGPGAEIFRGEVLADDRLDVIVDVAVLHVAHFAVVDEREQLRLVQLLQLLDERGDVGVFDSALLLLPPFADVVEEEHRSVDLHMLAADRGQPVRGLGFRALVVADAKKSLIDETNDGGEDVIAIELLALEIGPDAAAQRGERLAEFNDALELFLLALRTKSRMVEVLRAALLVDADGLKRRGVAAGDAHVLPRRRNAQLADAGEGLFVVDRVAGGAAVREAGFLASFAPDAVKVEVPSPTDSLSRHDARDFCENGAGLIEYSTFNSRDRAADRTAAQPRHHPRALRSADAPLRDLALDVGLGRGAVRLGAAPLRRRAAPSASARFPAVFRAGEARAVCDRRRLSRVARHQHRVVALDLSGDLRAGAVAALSISDLHHGVDAVLLSAERLVLGRHGLYRRAGAGDVARGRGAAVARRRQAVHVHPRLHFFRGDDARARAERAAGMAVDRGIVAPIAFRTAPRRRRRYGHHRRARPHRLWHRGGDHRHQRFHLRDERTSALRGHGRRRAESHTQADAVPSARLSLRSVRIAFSIDRDVRVRAARVFSPAPRAVGHRADVRAELSAGVVLSQSDRHQPSFPRLHRGERAARR